MWLLVKRSEVLINMQMLEFSWLLSLSTCWLFKDSVSRTHEHCMRWDAHDFRGGGGQQFRVGRLDNVQDVANFFKCTSKSNYNWEEAAGSINTCWLSDEVRRHCDLTCCCSFAELGSILDTVSKDTEDTAHSCILSVSKILFQPTFISGICI